MVTNPAVSVIIPMYNAKKYIGECLDSLLAQTFQNFEVVVVDDCSTDESVEVVESFADKFNGRLNIFHTEKNSGGACLPRNEGLKNSCGEYVFFMDADDLLRQNGLEEMHGLAKGFNADVVDCTKAYKMSEDGKEITIIDVNAPLYDAIIDENISQRVENLMKNKFDWHVWLRFSRREFLIENELFFPEGVEYGENQIWTHGLLFCAEKILHLPYPYYFYRYQSENSIIWKKRDSRQIVNVRLNVVIEGLLWIDDVMAKTPFFQQNPQLRHKILDHFTRRIYNGLFKHTLKTQQWEIYESLKEDFGQNFGEHDVLIPALLTLVNTNQKKIDNLKKKLNIK